MTALYEEIDRLKRENGDLKYHLRTIEQKAISLLSGGPIGQIVDIRDIAREAPKRGKDE